jgi:hypothetical protein
MVFILKEKLVNFCWLLVYFTTLSFVMFFHPGYVFAANAPDFNSSSLQAFTNSGAGQAPADGNTILKVTVTLKDANGAPLSGDTVSILVPGDASMIINPASAILDGNGQATFNVTSVDIGNYSINVTDISQNVTLASLGKITFYSTLCSDTPPGSAPKLISATAISTAKILLKWTAASDPVSYYLLSYGVTSGQYIYGNPNVGGHDTTSYVVGGLAPNKKYYFVVRAGNGCSPGSFSNELSAATVLNVATPVPIEESISTPIPSSTPVIENTPEPEISTPVPQTTPETSVEKPAFSPTVIAVMAVGGISLLVIGFILYKKSFKS